MPSRRFATVLAVGLLLPLALTACGSGRSPEGYAERPTVDAAQASLGDLQLRNVHIAPPADGEAELPVGATATVTLSVVNIGEAPDRLVQVSSDIATSVEVLGADKQPTQQVDIPPLGAIGNQDFSISLVGLTRAIRPGEHAQITFTFTRAGRRTLTVPVEVYTSPLPRPTYNVFEQPEGSPAAG